MSATAQRPPRAHAEVTGRVRIVARPVGDYPLAPTLVEIRTAGKRPVCCCYAVTMGNDGHTATLAKASAGEKGPDVLYTVRLYEQACDCKDAAYRARACKHLKALNALREHGLI